MELISHDVTLQVDGQPARAWTSRPARANSALPGIVLIQEAFGVDAFIEDVAARLATAGYEVIAPDLFSLGGTPPALERERVDEAKRFLDTVPPAAWFDASQRQAALDLRPPDERAALSDTLAALLPADRPWDRYLATLAAGRDWLAERDAARPIGCVGFCLGGALSFRLACTTPIRACVVFYGMAPAPELLAGLTAPVLAHYAGEDPRINAGVPGLTAAMASAGKRFEAHSYPGTRHAFMNDTRANYDVAAARIAWARTLSFFATELG